MKTLHFSCQLNGLRNQYSANRPQDYRAIQAIKSPTSNQHAENVLLEDLKNDKIPYANVKEWYTELQPCNAPLHSCRDSLVKLTPDAKVTYTFNYDHYKKNDPVKHEVKEWENFVKTKKFNE